MYHRGGAVACKGHLFLIINFVLWRRRLHRTLSAHVESQSNLFLHDPCKRINCRLYINYIIIIIICVVCTTTVAIRSCRPIKDRTRTPMTLTRSSATGIPRCYHVSSSRPGEGKCTQFVIFVCVGVYVAKPHRSCSPRFIIYTRTEHIYYNTRRGQRVLN